MMDRRSQHDFPAKRIDITGFLTIAGQRGGLMNTLTITSSLKPLKIG